jgi:hypothetical protein
MDVESFPQVGLPIGQILPPTTVGDYENDNWQMQNLNHRRRRSRKDWNSSHFRSFSLVRVKVCTCEYKHLDICNRGLYSKAS